ncbi:MAG: hypothetical protein H0T79_21875 [Deltaproteobacteria bacterium]|nr:hypothetical protein [Deltaproteobacteria bacterium]
MDAKVPTHRAGHHAAPPSRMPRSTAQPENVIPFTKPRAMAAIAAAHPNNVAVTPHTRPRDPDATSISRPPVMEAQPRWQPQTPAQNPWNHNPTTQTTPTWSASENSAPAYKTVPVAPPALPVPPVPAAPQALVPAFPAFPAAAQPVALPAAPKHDPHKWAIYDKLGLGMPKLNKVKAAKLIVSAYRVLGFVILTIIVAVLVGYIATTAFFYMSNSWVVPMAVSPSDEKVVSLQANLAEQQNQRDRITDELLQAERLIVSQQSFQSQFALAIKSDLDGRKAALGKIRALASAAASTRAQIRAQSSAYASASNRRMAEEYKAGLIDRNSMLSGKFQVAQITSSNLSLAERQADYETKAAELEQNAKSLDALLDNAGGDTALSYDVLRIKQELEASRLDLAKAVENHKTLKSSLERQEKLIASLEKSAYLRAVGDKATVAFVPYSNLSNSKKGEPLYKCHLSMIICTRVGEVLEVLPGEVQFKHPQKEKQLRGQMVEMKLDADDADAAEDDVLFVGGKPLLF